MFEFKSISIFVIIILNSIFAISCVQNESVKTPAIEKISEYSILNNKPILKIESQGHISSILNLALNEKKQIFATSSSDKTIRIWDLNREHLIQTIRLPIGKSNIGRMQGIAISPDGNTLAAGGSSLVDEKVDTSTSLNQSVYIIKLSSGKVFRRLQGIPGLIYSIKYSDKGNYLAVGYYATPIANYGTGQSGVRIFKSDSYNVLKDIPIDYQRLYPSLDFNSNGNLIIAGRDGYLRLYDNQFQLIKKMKMIYYGKINPISSVEFSSDSSKIAIRSLNYSSVDIRSGTNLDFVSRIGYVWGGLNGIAWSKDSNFINIGIAHIDRIGKLGMTTANWNITYSVKPKFTIDKYSTQYNKSEKKIFIKRSDVGNDTITQIASLEDGRILFCTKEPSIGYVSKNWNNRLIMPRPFLTGLSGYHRSLRVSNDGMEIELTSRTGTIRFSIKDQ